LIFQITPFITPTYPSRSPKSVNNEMIAMLLPV
jgi:hypothetical protein